jgi:hypothetical protein
MEWFVSLVMLAFLTSPLLAVVLLLLASDDRTRKCPHCAEFIKPEAIVCKHCGSNVVSSKDTIADFIRQAGKARKGK